MNGHPEPPRTPSLREQALEVIRLAIATGELDEGRIYSAAGLAKQLGMSLSPVREAMMSLVTEGTVEAIPNRGFRLVPISPADLEEIIRVRLLLSEPAAKELCARSRAGDPESGEVLARLRALASDALAAAEAGNDAEFHRVDREFHRSLLRYGLGSRAADISLRLRDQSRLGGILADSEISNILSGQDLIDIVDLIERGDENGAVACLRRNLFYFKRAEGYDAEREEPSRG